MLRQLTREPPAGRVGKTRADRMECSGVGTTRSENRASAWNRIVLKVLFSTVKRKRRRRTVKSLSAVTLVVLLVLAVASLSCGGGNHLVSIAVSPNPATIDAPGSIQFTAIGTFSDGTMKVLSSANWTFSSSSSAITVSSSGLATCGVQGGPVAEDATVTASIAGLSGSTMLSCNSPGV